ncbi:MAG: hypothetical protein KKB90_13275, partial [Actinobacteria bacterium]|nr:hypothetical protein [Actinomycetota bacterium]MCG2818333.1 hypothetical protein [Actinomycetes bacterium]MBU4219910.1 hypothetical protein [Actinomycetota bacterium]MBU4357974.1 hypothetical protein [Actinomycetota bacterium]MBU4391614.1 hypothetical protein [Actinomycetota bacterium]
MRTAGVTGERKAVRLLGYRGEVIFTRRAVFFKGSHPSIKTATVLLVVLLCTLLMPPVYSGGQEISPGYDFNDPGEYVYDSDLIEFSNGKAMTKKLPLQNGWWTKTHNTSGGDYAWGVSCDSQGRATVAASANTKWFVRQYGADGRTLWTSSLTGSDSYAKGVSCDLNDNAIVTGYIDAGADKDLYTKKYGPGGSELWTKQHITGGDQYGKDVSCDSGGNAFIAGLEGPLGNNERLMAKYESDGTFGWSVVVGGAGNDGANGVSCGPDNNPVFAGYLTGGADLNVWVRKSTGLNGADMWTRTHDGGGGNDLGAAVSCDSNGNPVVAGHTKSGTDQDIWVRKYSSSGDTLWTQTISGGPDLDGAHGISHDRDDNVVVAGYTETADNFDIWVGKLRGTDGKQLWTTTYSSGNGFDEALDVSCDEDGNPVVAGYVGDATNYAIWVRKYPPGEYASSSPTVTTKRGLDVSGGLLAGFEEKLGGGNQGTVTYQLSPDGSDWYYYDGTWKKHSGGSGMDASGPDTNTAAEVDRHIGKFSSIASSSLYVRAFLDSNSMQKVELDHVSVRLTTTSFYFAEGTCRPGFDPYICIQNPGATDADVKVTYMLGDGTTQEDSFAVS